MTNTSMWHQWQIDQNTAFDWIANEAKNLSIPITASVDLRCCNSRLINVDTNLFPAGFNNLGDNAAKYAIKLLKTRLHDLLKDRPRVCLLTEEHTRNIFYNKSVMVLKGWLEAVGYEVIISNINIDWAAVAKFDPGIFLLNHDLSANIPEELLSTKIPILPIPELGWARRRKSEHFNCYKKVVEKFATDLNTDAWYFLAKHKVVSEIDFMAKIGLDNLQENVQFMLENLRNEYRARNWPEEPYVVIKSDYGTYGMNIIVVKDAQAVKDINRKQRTKMATGKHGVPLNSVLLQEGIRTSILCDHKTCEPVIYTIAGDMIGGFYRSHAAKNNKDNLNSPGMSFDIMQETEGNYTAYGLVAKLAVLAAGMETREILLSEGK